MAKRTEVLHFIQMAIYRSLDDEYLLAMKWISIDNNMSVPVKVA